MLNYRSLLLEKHPEILAGLGGLLVLCLPSNESTEVVGPVEGQPVSLCSKTLTVCPSLKKGGNPVTSVRCRDELTFEETFFKRFYFAKHHTRTLDHILNSLLRSLDDPDSEIEKIGNYDILLKRNHTLKRLKDKVGQTAFNRIKAWIKKDPKARELYPTWEDLDREFKIPIDMLCGECPMRFRNLTLVKHSLRLSWAIFLSFRMFFIQPKHGIRMVDGRKMKFIPTRQLLWSKLFVHCYQSLRSKEREFSEKKIIKKLKNSLCMMLSLELSQEELPQGDWFDYLPSDIRSFLNKNYDTETRVRFAFSCLQSKVLCQEVPEDFVLDALIEHRDKLSTPHRGLKPETLEMLRKRGRQFGKLVQKFYRPHEGFQPSGKATFSHPRGKGGVKGDLLFNKRFLDSDYHRLCDPDDRMEPFVVGLFGSPGHGKSTRINELISLFARFFPKLTRDDLVYQRTCHVEHWDGYKNQPIVILDDLGQSISGHDIQEFQTLVSTVPYVLPMADLSEKGRKFSSPIIIATSNLLFGRKLIEAYPQGSPIIDDASFWRRFHFPIWVEDQQYYCLQEDQFDFVHEKRLLFRHPHSVNFSENYSHDRCRFKPYNQLNEFQKNLSGQVCPNYWNPEPMKTFKPILERFTSRIHLFDNFRNKWIQNIVTEFDNQYGFEGLSSLLDDFHVDTSLGIKLPQGKKIQHSLQFPTFPPDQILPVRVEPIKEPLKVRTITAGIGDGFCLKPFQSAMWKALGLEPQFCLTHGTNNLENAIARIYSQSGPDDVWISGDYSAATDSFAIEASKELLEGILESIPHEPTRRWARKEISPHLLVYPKSSGLEPVVQKSGQLMGSLLSFPLLCLLNDCTAKYLGLKPEQYLINGDDILMRTRKEKYDMWKEKVHEFGLSLSLGKNYVHPEYGTVNSQLIYKGDVLQSGKQRVLDRHVNVLGECLRDLELYASTEKITSTELQNLFKEVNRQKLSRTIRNIHVPTSHGGLSLTWGKRDLSDKKSERMIKLVYLHEFLQRLKPDSGCIAFPYLAFDNENPSNLDQIQEAILSPVTNKEFVEDFLHWREVRSETKKVLEQYPLFRKLISDEDVKVENFPSLNFIKTYQIPIKDIQVRGELQREINRKFSIGFFETEHPFTYRDFRRRILEKSIGISHKEMAENRITKQHLLEITDFVVEPQFITKNIDFSVQKKGISLAEFEKDLGNNINPKLSLDDVLCNMTSSLIEETDFTRDYLLGINHWEKLSDFAKRIDLDQIMLKAMSLDLIRQKQNGD